jgi:GNAT superfamily N-acetyltransferase
MSLKGLIKITPESQEDFRKIVSPIPLTVWPTFLHQDPIAKQHWDGLYSNFPPFQFGLVTEEDMQPAALVNSAPLRWEKDLQDLTGEGWDWALIKSARDKAAGVEPNCLCGLQISIHPDFQGRGLSSQLLEMMVDLAREQHLFRVIIPVRPTWKDRYPLIPMEKFLTWQDKQGLPYDPWLRVHVRAGGEILTVCPSAMRIPGSAADWEEWTGLRFFESGEYIVPGALRPVSYQRGQDLGVYLEPNVWVVHEVEHE